jgi:hypothetical protein
MEAKFYIDLNTDEDDPFYVEISEVDSIPKNNVEHIMLMKKYGANKAQRNRYRVLMGLSPE